MLLPNDHTRRWEILSTEYLIRRPWLTARRDKVRLPDGRINPEYYVVEYILFCRGLMFSPKVSLQKITSTTIQLTQILILTQLETHSIRLNGVQ